MSVVPSSGPAPSQQHATDSLFWRRLAHWGASRGPNWWVRYSPPVFGWLAAAFVPGARRAVRANLERIRGPVSTTRDTREVLETFSTYASCVAEVLSNDAPDGPKASHAHVRGELHMRDAIAEGKGIVLVTAHTAGWETAGPLLARFHDIDIMLVMQSEADRRAQQIHDRARQLTGLAIANVGDSPFSSLPILRHIKGGGVAALQIDRYAPGMRTRKVRVLDKAGDIPEGPLMLAKVTGAPILPVFCARIGFRTYLIKTYEARHLSKNATDAEIDEVAQHLADCLSAFLRENPTQWFQFRNH